MVVVETKHNEIFSLAWEMVEHTSCNLFLTGKAGTGKTTFLKHLCEHTSKNAVVVAPTGVAAINAGGVTIHSLFQLPFLNFIPEYKTDEGNINFVNRHTLFRGMKLSRTKIDLLNELELLIVDEVSMVRADMLDMIDESLRHFRNIKSPFGGVQVLFIGDMFQLPPVVKEQEWNTLSKYYSSPFFFSAKVLENNRLLFLELKIIYRQSEEKFIRILNHIRTNNCSKEDLDELNKRCIPTVKKESITLVTHNYMAEEINQEELKKLKTPLHKFTADVRGNFSESMFPCEIELHLKTGAWVMFIKNDSSGEKKYYNGKLAVIKSMDRNDEGEDEIIVELSNSGETFSLEKEKWSNIQYRLNKGTGKIEEEEIGSFTQYPVRLAWAVTIHKSQGLSFDNVAINAGKSFAAGQVYVALSRCRTLDGVTLLSPINNSHIIVDKQIIDFSTREDSFHDLTGILSEEKRKYAAASLVRAFDWKIIIRELKKFAEYISEKQLPDKTFAEETILLLLKNSNDQHRISEKFIAELNNRIFEAENPVNEKWLNQKVVGAKNFFIEKIQTELILHLHSFQSHLRGKKKVKQFIKYLDDLELFFLKQIKTLERASFETFAFEIPPVEKKAIVKAKIEKQSASVGLSKLETLNFYKQGMKAHQIAEQRGMAISTIEGHLAGFVSTGEVNIYDFLDEVLLEKIKTVALKTGFEKLSPIKNELGELATYGQIRMAVNYLKNEKSTVEE